MEPVNIRHISHEIQTIGHLTIQYGTLRLRDEDVQIVNQLSKNGASLAVKTKAAWDRVCSEIFNIPADKIPVVDFSNRKIFVFNWNCADASRFPCLVSTRMDDQFFVYHTIPTEVWRPAATPLSVLLVTSIPHDQDPLIITDDLGRLSLKDFDEQLKQLENELKELEKQGNQEEIVQKRESINLRKESVRLQLMGPKLN